jgi:hypothetical protein
VGRRARAASPSRGLASTTPSRARPIGLLKIDCEGLELEVLESSTGVLPTVEHVVVEYHRHLLADADRRVAAFLAARGFAVRVQTDRYEPALGYVTAWRPRRNGAPRA